MLLEQHRELGGCSAQGRGDLVIIESSKGHRSCRLPLLVCFLGCIGSSSKTSHARKEEQWVIIGDCCASLYDVRVSGA